MALPVSASLVELMMSSDLDTINQVFKLTADRYRDREFLRYKLNGQWRSLTYSRVACLVCKLALGLYSMGLRKGDRIAIWSENRPEWNIADLATLSIGAIDVPIYTNQSRSQVDYIMRDSGARAIFTSASFLGESIRLKESLPSLQLIISFDESPGLCETAISAAQVMERGQALNNEAPELYERLWREVEPADLATLIYTSGTTGEPKGVMLTHKNLAANTLNVCRWLGLGDRRDLALSYLPLAHIFERSAWYVYMHAGIEIAYAESFDAVPRNLLEVRPTVMTSVPRMFEKIYARLLNKGLSGLLKRQVLLWAIAVAKRWSQRRMSRRGHRQLLLALQHKLADLLVYRKWRAALGGRIRCFISGGAPLAPDIAHIFCGAGLTILQGYGLTETSPSVSCNTEDQNCIGSVGRVIAGVEVKLAEDGEILVRGDTVTIGYYNRAEAGSEAFTEDGWFRTGDVGYLDEHGCLVITDRKKDLIKTSGGKYVAPQRIESLIKASRFVSEVVVVGNGRKFISALIVPNMQMLRSYAELKGIGYSDTAQLISDPRIIALFERQVDKYTAELARFEKVKKIALLERELSLEGGELTPTLKARRSIIEAKYKPLIDKLYEDELEVAAV
jgi:long-chain acyl-CoA synthetase